MLQEIIKAVDASASYEDKPSYATAIKNKKVVKDLKKAKSKKK